MPETTQILTATVENFASVIVETSHRVPVLIDFWADWCAPCRALTPVLERIALDYANRLVLATLNVDEEQALAGQFGVRSIPTVVLMKDGRIVDQFTGVQPDATIRAMLDRHVPAAAPGAGDPVVRAHTLAQAGDHTGAIRILEEALTERPEEPVLLAALAGLRLLARDAVGAESAIARIEARDPHFPALGTLRARIGFLETALAWPDAGRARAALTADPNDAAARHALASHHAVAGDYDAALEEWLELMRRNRAHGDDVARRSMLAVFDLLGSADDRVAAFRRRLASLLH